MYSHKLEVGKHARDVTVRHILNGRMKCEFKRSDDDSIEIQAFSTPTPIIK